MDPLNIIARSHDLALCGRVVDYRPEQLDALMYHDRAFFEYGGNLRVYPMDELPYWRVSMRQRSAEPRWVNFAKQNRPLLKEVRAELQARGPLGNRDFSGRQRVNSYRGRKDSALALYYLWLTGEVMVHHRLGFERVYDFRENIVPAAVNYAATAREAEHFFARKAFAFQGWCSARGWARWLSFFTGRKLSPAEVQRWLGKLLTAGEISRIVVEGEKEPYYLRREDAAFLSVVSDGGVPEAWRPLETSTQDEVIFLAPLETVIAYRRAKALFAFDYIWEVYKPAAQRRWGYYTLPVLYGDQLVARLDPKLDRKAKELVINGFWLENESAGHDIDFADALARGLTRLATFVKAHHVDVSAIGPCALRMHLQSRLHEFTRRRES
jgi:hypothetical protein